MDLLKRQKEIIETIKKTHTNFNKDSGTRKTEDYIRKRISSLDSLWTEFDINHKNILTANIDETDEYLVKDIYTDTKLLYERIRIVIKNYSPSDNDDDGKQPIDDLLSEQRTNFRALRRQINNIDLDKITEKWELEDELRNLQSRWKNIDVLHLKIDNMLNGEDAGYEEEFYDHEKKFRAIKRLLNTKISSAAHQYESTPKVEVPLFSGDYTQWPTFLDLYKSSIHDNPTLSDSQKMQHLKGKLRGEAHRLIQHLNVTADNYRTAWEILYHRYHNVQILFNKYIEIFLNQRTIERQTSAEIKRVHDTTMECIHAIHNLGVDTSSWDPLLVYLLLQKLDPETRSDYKESRKTPRELPEFDEFMEFLEAKFTALEPTNKRERENWSATKQPTSYKAKENSHFGAGNRAQFYKGAHVTFANTQCILCNSNHALYLCRKYDAMTTDAKLKLIAKHRLCKNCLYFHERNVCNSTKRCKICNDVHHTSLHNSNVDSNASTLNSKPQRQQHATNNVTSEDDEILLTTVQIRVRAIDGTYLTMRALLDQGSQTTLITENAAQLLGLPRQSLNASITGVGISAKRSKGKIQLHCLSIHDDYSFTTDALVMPKLVNSLPQITFESKKYPHLQHIKLADPEYNISKRVDILLDAKIYSEILMGGLIKGTKQQPIAQQTKLGWILSGPVTTFNCHVVLNGVEDIANYWEVEEIASETTSLTQQEMYCEELYVNTTKRLPDGRYEVQLPMKEDFQQHLGHSKARAVAQFKQLENRLTKNNQLRHSYEQFIHEYINLGHMCECNERKEPMCYLPHHGVHREDSLTTKLRVVFNASSKTSTGKSLNDLMECGPKLQQDIQNLLLRWRTYRYVYTADCEKMYRCILLHPDQQHLQKILWRDSAQDILREYQLCTVTYGMKAAPYLAMRTMQQLALDEAHKYPDAAEVLKKDFYVDDLLSGSYSIEHAKEVQRQLIEMLQSARINLRKWSSNCPELLSQLTTEQINPTTIDLKNANSTKALGLRWNPACDVFTFHPVDEYNDSSQCTKRMLLSDISKIFDPLGWLSPLTIRAKLLFQKLWLTSMEWDDEVPRDIQQDWNKIRADLMHIDQFQIPRWIGDIYASVEIHGFCDASERAYAGVVYLKTKNDNGQVTVRLIASKTKLAPRKNTMTLPRLELCGALLLSKLMDKILKSLQKPDVPIYGWTDSLVVMGWLQGHPSRWKTFIANRTKEILKVMPSSSWRHVTSSENAADCATRGLTTSQLMEHSLWWEGPDWIKNDVPKDIPQVDTPQLELKKDVQICTTQVTNTMFEQLLNKQSSIDHAVRVIARVLRFTTNLRHAMRHSSTVSYVGNKETYLTAKEIETAYEIIIRAVQMQEFQSDINQLKKNGTVHSKSRLLTLTPYLDENQTLRVGGRLQHSKLSENEKHPMILPKDSRLTELLIKQAHLRTLHGGPGLTLTYLRQKYWVLGGNRTIKKYLRSCVKCTRFNSHKQHQIMADLPGARVTPSRPFTHAGVDFTGQVELKANKGRGIKTTRGYIAVFVCFSTKAIHLELVSDLSTQAFLAAFKRMCARRGTPKHMYSDNGTNFVGASRLLKKEYKEVLNTINHDFLSDVAEMGVTWHLNAPAWPSAGGLWEAAVKSTKHHLKRVLGEQKLTFEEFTTLLTQIEACLNSRPLCALTENEEDSFLTPGHFLVGGPLLSPPMTDADEPCIRNRWQLTEKMHREFWRKWSSDYLQHLQTRSKWNHTREDLKINDIVLIKEENMPPTKWAMGRVTNIHPGKDGHVRVVTLRTKNGELTRPIIKLVPLPVNPEQDSRKPTSNNDEPKKDDSSTPRRLRNNRGKRTTLTNVLLLLLAFLTPAIEANANIKSVSNNTLFFDKISDVRIIQDQWKLIVYYNMTIYWHSITAVEKYIYSVNKTCNNDPSCAHTVSQFAHELDELRHYNELLTNQHHILHRKKRGLINGAGYLANTLFGVLDDRFAQKYEKDIETVKEREEHLLTLFKNQTSLLEAENNILKRNEQIMNTQFEQIYKHLRVISTEMNQIEKQNQNALQAFHVLSSLISADVIISSLRRTQDTLLDIVTDIYNGRLNIHLLTPREIQQQLNVISGHLQGDVVVPTDNFRDLYGLLHVQAKVTKRFLIMEIKIPLLNRDQFELNDVIDIPQKHGDTYIYTSTETKYLAVNVKKDTVVPMTEHDIHNCIRHTHKQMLCPLNQPVYTMQVGESLCDIKLQISNENKPYCRSQAKVCTDRWIKLHTRDTWLFSCCTECSVRIICSNDVKLKHLRGNGLIGLDSGCTIKGETFIIYAQHDYTNQIYMHPEIDVNIPTISTLNEYMNVSLPENFIAENHEQLFTSIKKNVDSIKEQELQKFEYNNSTHYIVIYSILFLMTTVLLTLAFCNLKRGWMKLQERKPKEDNPNPPMTTIETSFSEVTTPPPPSSSPFPKMTGALQGSTVSVDTATSPIIPRKIHFNLNASTSDINYCNC